MTRKKQTVSDPAADALIQADIFAYLGGWPTVIVLIVDVLLTLGLISLVTRRLRMRYTFRRMLIAAEKLGKTVPPRELIRHETIDPAPMTVPALLVFLAGIVSAIGLYLFDIISMLGG